MKRLKIWHLYGIIHLKYGQKPRMTNIITYSWMIVQDLPDNRVSGKHYPEFKEEILGIRAGQHIIFYPELKK